MAKTEALPGGGHKVSASHEERKSKKKKLRRLSVQRAKNGGHTVEHEYHSNGNGYEPPTTHVFGRGDGAGLLAHLRRHLGIVMGGGGAPDVIAGREGGLSDQMTEEEEGEE